MSDGVRQPSELRLRSFAHHPLVRSAAFRAVFLADVCVTVAERSFVLIFTWWLLSRPEGGAARLALLMGLESVPALAVGFLLGPVIDRFDKRRLMGAGALAQTVVAGGVAFLFARGELSFAGLCVAGSLLGCLLPAFEASVNAALPELVSEDQILAASAVQTSTLELSNVAAAAMVFGMLAGVGFVGVLVVIAALYAVGAALVLRAELSWKPRTPSKGAYLADLKAGVTYVLGERGLPAFVGVYLVKLLLTVPLLVLIPMLVRDKLGDAPGWAGILETTFSVGSIATAVVLSLQPAPRAFYRSYAAGLALLGVLMLGLPGVAHPGWMLPAAMLMGAAMAAILALSNVLFQRTVSDGYKGRFFGLLETLDAAITPAGYALMGTVSSTAGVDGVLMASGVGLLCLTGVVLVIPRVRPG
jgi:MFS-type transporter involved in bile tolerance (Atg22 family)